MNYLAHAYLSFQDPEITVGQIIADHVKGSQIQAYTEGIQKGIRMHRKLDMFTDKHPASIRAKEILAPSCGRYAAVFVDISYDYFLANDSKRFPILQLEAFSQWVYQLLEEHYAILPQRFQSIYPYMRKQNWLKSYRSKSGIEQSFQGIIRRAKYFERNPSEPFQGFEQHLDVLGLCFQEIMIDAYAYMLDCKNELLH
jgi:acyl carrier protein phosphodiesterase